jgi:chromate transporter
MSITETRIYKPSLAQLYLSFLRLGVTAFGGPAMVAYIRKMAVEQKGWLEPEDFKDGAALCQMIPGATAMQTAAYVGLKVRGIPGAAVSYLGFGFPAFLLMLSFAALYASTRSMPAVLSAFSGLQAIIVAVIANATLTFGKTTLKKWPYIFIAILAAILFGLSLNPILILLIAAVAGLAVIKPEPRTGIIRSNTPLPSSINPIIGILVVYGLGLLVLYLSRKNLFDLSLLFFRIDLMAFGGGFASVPLIFHEIVDVRGWLDSQTLMNGIVLGQVTPGPIVITATFVGYLIGGWLGGIVATISIFLPSFLLIIGIAPYFEHLRASPIFQKVIGGVLCSFVGLLATVTIRFALNIQWDLAHGLLSGAALIALLLKVDILWVILIGTILSIMIFL